MAKVNYQSLYIRYQRTLDLEGEEYFRSNILEPLREEERDGAIVSTGVMDENTGIRRSAIPIELRVSAAEGALIDFRSGCDANSGGVKSVNLDRGCSSVNL